MKKPNKANKVTLKLNYPLNEYAGDRTEFDVLINMPITLKNLLIQLGVPLQAIGFAAINGALVTLDGVVQNEDNIVVFPLINGG